MAELFIVCLVFAFWFGLWVSEQIDDIKYEQRRAKTMRQIDSDRLIEISVVVKNIQRVMDNEAAAKREADNQDLLDSLREAMIRPVDPGFQLREDDDR